MNSHIYVYCQEYFCTCGCSGRHTFDAIVEVLVWSFNLLFEGKWPLERHDGRAFDDVHNRGFSVHKSKPVSEKTRKATVGQLFGFRAMLQQCRGDWMWYKELVSFPSWASNYICWKCEASQTTYKQFGAKAPWRQKRLTPLAFCSKQTKGSRP